MTIEWPCPGQTGAAFSALAPSAAPFACPVLVAESALLRTVAVDSGVGSVTRR